MKILPDMPLINGGPTPPQVSFDTGKGGVTLPQINPGPGDDWTPGVTRVTLRQPLAPVAVQSMRRSPALGFSTNFERTLLSRPFGVAGDSKLF